MNENGTVALDQDTPVRLHFADRQRGIFSPLGDAGLQRWGGVIHEEITPTLRGSRWYRVVREMLHNPTIKGMLFATEMLIRRAEWMMEPAEGDDIDPDEAQRIADFVDSCRADMREPWEDTLAQLLSFLPYGFSIMEIVLKRRLGESRAQQPSAYDDGLIGWDDWAPRAQDTITRWVFDEWGYAIAVEQQAPMASRLVTIPLSRCLHFRASGYKGSPEGESALRAAYIDWDAIRKIELLEGIRIEKDATGVLTLYIPSAYLSETATPQQVRVFQAAKDIVTGYHSHEQAGFVFPLEYNDKGNPLFKAELMRTGGETTVDTSAVISRRTTQMTRAMLAEFLTLGQTSTGSYALSKTKTDLFITAIAAWIDVIANTINDQAIKPLLRLNGIDSRLTPTLRPGPLDEADLAATGEFLSKLLPLISQLNADDRLALTAHLFDVADWPAVTTTLEDEPTSVEVPTPEPDEPGEDDEEPEDDAIEDAVEDNEAVTAAVAGGA